MSAELDRGLDQYQLALPGFEGPLDVLLRLIERDQLPITSISIVTVTGQFLHHLGGLIDASPTVVAEFSSVAARLLVLKSRALIPQPAPEPPEIELDLVEQLREHQALRQAAVLLRTLDQSDAELFPANIHRGLTRTRRAAKLGIHEPALLARALFRRLTTLPTQPVDKPVAPVVSLQQMITRVLDCLNRAGSCSLQRVLGREPTRDEEIAGFLALLVLIRRRVVTASQQIRFGEIAVEHITPASPLEPNAADRFAAKS